MCMHAHTLERLTLIDDAFLFYRVKSVGGETGCFCPKSRKNFVPDRIESP